MSDFRQATFLDRTSPPHIVTLVMLAGVGALAMNIFLPSLPSMTEYFNTEYAVMQLAVTLYLGLNGVIQLVIGPLSDRFGRRPVILAGMAIFLLATVGCLLSTSIEMFLVFRMIQTTIAIGMTLSRAIVRDIVSTDQAASMIGYVTMGMSLVPMIAPAIGGFLNDLAGWHANFAMLLVLGVLVFALAYFDLGETNRNRSTSMLAQVREYPELLKSRRFWGYAATATASSGAFFAFLGAGPYIGTIHFGLSATELGFYYAFVATGYLVGNWASGRFSIRFGINTMMISGATVMSGGLVLAVICLMAGMDHPLTYFGLMTLVGVGNGLTLPNSNAGLVSVRPRLAGSASGLGGAIQISGGGALAALAGNLMSEQSGAMNLLLLQLVCGLAAIAAIFSIIRIDRAEGALARASTKPEA
jgi:DHA1 family bicyclomycin/chloramphenicol resistance-like MFS transporter